MTYDISRRGAITALTSLGIAVPLGPTLAGCSGSSETQLAPLDATKGQIPQGSGTIFAESGVVVTQPAAGDFKGFTNVCTHRGCPVSDVTSTINCKCHGSQFSIEDGSVVNGPATEGLAAMPLTVEGNQISLA